MWCDRAPSHIAKQTKEKLDELFDEVVFQPGKSPDTNHCDAGVFPYMERVQQDSICWEDEDDAQKLRSSVHAAYAKVDANFCRRVANRVRRNMKKIIAKDGGNYYNETGGRDIDANVDPSCVACKATYTADKGKHAMLFCEKCNQGTHVSCAKLRAVPRGAWFCDECKD